MQPGNPENQGDNPFWESSLDPFQRQSGNPENQGDNPFWESSPDPFQSQQYSDYRPRQSHLNAGIEAGRWVRSMRLTMARVLDAFRKPFKKLGAIALNYRPPLTPRRFQYPPLYYTAQRRRSDLWQWYRTRTRNMKIGIGCGAIMAVLLFFSCIIAASASITGTLMPTPTATPIRAAVIASPTVPHQTPISIPTQEVGSTPTPAPTQRQQPPQNPTTCSGVNCNPWGYNFFPGNYITEPPSNFCSYFTCISDFWSGHGYVVECQDGKYTKLGGLRGPCWHHAGDQRTLYSH